MPDSDPVPFYPVPEEVKPYVVFSKGSYWIYEEINSGYIDSVYLYRVETERRNDGKKLGYDYELLTANYKRSFTGDSVRAFGEPFHSDEKLWAYSEFKIGNPSADSYVLTFLSPLSRGEERRYAEDFSLALELVGVSLELEGRTYNDVMVFKHNLMFFLNQSERIYFSKHIGIIKRELFNGEVWVLKRHFINP